MKGVILPNDAPVVDSAPDGSVDEDAREGRRIVTVTASDPDVLTTLVWSLDEDSRQVFDIVPDAATNSAELRVGRLGLDFEMASSHEVTVTVTDLGSLTGSETLTVTVNNVEEEGILSLAPLLPELRAPIYANIIDPDGGVTDTTWRWWRGDGADGPWAPIPGETSATYTPSDADLGKYLRVDATYRDSLGPGKSARRITGDEVVTLRGDRSAGIEQPGHFGVGRPGVGLIADEGDGDWFRFFLEAGKVYRIDMLGADSGDGELLDPHLTGLYAVFNNTGTLKPDGIVDADGDRVRRVWRDWNDDDLHMDKVYYNDDGGQGHNARMYLRTHPSNLLGTPQGDPAGAYFIEAGSLPVHRQAAGSYRMTLTEITDDDASVRSMTVGEVATGEVNWPGDQDIFEVNLAADTRYVVEVRPTGWWGRHWRDRLDAPGISRIERTVPGQSVSFPETNGLDRGIYPFTPTSSGAYRITVTGFGLTKQHFATGPYSLRVIPDPQSAVQSEATIVTADGTAENADLGYRKDIDWFKVELDPGMDDSKTFRIEARGLDSGSGTLEDPRIYVDLSTAEAHLYDGDGGMGRDTRVYVTVGTGGHSEGTWYISVNAQDGGTGTYELTVSEVPDSFVWSTRMLPTQSDGSPTGFCAPVTNARCAVDASIRTYGHLDDDDFMYDGDSYEILSVRYSAGNDALRLNLNEALPQSDLAQMVFTVKGADYAFSNASVSGTQGLYSWGGVTEPPLTLGTTDDHFVLVEISSTP